MLWMSAVIAQPLLIRARPEQRRAQALITLAIERHERQQGQVAPRVAVPIKEGQLLRAMCRVIGGIEVNGDQARATVEPSPMSLDHPRASAWPNSYCLIARSSRPLMKRTRARMAAPCC